MDIATTTDRATADAPVDPSTQSWLYRSEAFAEDLDELMAAARAVVAPSRAERRKAPSSTSWPSALSAAFWGRAQRAA